MVDRVLAWLQQFVDVDGAILAKELQHNVPVSDIIHAVFLILIDGSGNAFIVTLFVLYLLFETTQHVPGSLRAQIDNQIQR